MKQLACSSNGIAKAHVAWVYDKTEAGSPLRRLIADDFLHKTSFGKGVTEDKSLPREFFAEVFARLREWDVPISKACSVGIGIEDYYMNGNKAIDEKESWGDEVEEPVDAAE